MKFTDKDLDSLLWEWAQMTINDHDSGYRSDTSFKIKVDHTTLYIPDYFPHPKINHLANNIFGLETDKRNLVVGKYLFRMNNSELGRLYKYHRHTVRRKIDEARQVLLDEMCQFCYKNNRL